MSICHIINEGVLLLPPPTYIYIYGVGCKAEMIICINWPGLESPLSVEIKNKREAFMMMTYKGYYVSSSVV